jgi:hypothetical protein
LRPSLLLSLSGRNMKKSCVASTLQHETNKRNDEEVAPIVTRHEAPSRGGGRGEEEEGDEGRRTVRQRVIIL